MPYPFSYRQYTGDGNTVTFSAPPFISTAHITVTLDKVPTSAFIWINATQIRFTEPPAAGVAIKIARMSNVESRLVDWQPGSINSPDLMNQADDQLFYLMQEGLDKYWDIVGDNQQAADDAAIFAQRAERSAGEARAAESEAKAAEINAEASATLANTNAGDANFSAVNAGMSADLASTKAGEAAQSATGAETARVLANNSATAAVDAKNLAVTAKDDAQLAAGVASGYVEECVTAKNDAQAAKTAALSASTAAQSARDTAIGARDNSLANANNAAVSAFNASESAAAANIHAGDALTAKTLAQNSAQAAVDAKVAAEAANTAAQTAHSNAESDAGLALQYKNDAQTANTNAQAANTAAQSAKTDAQSARDTAIGARDNSLANANNAAVSASNAYSYSVAAALAFDTIWVSAFNCIALTGSPVNGLVNGAPVKLLDASAVESVSCTVVIPSGWTYWTVEGWFINPTAAAGSIAVKLYYDNSWPTGVMPAVSASTGNSIVALPAQAANIQMTTFLSGQPAAAGNLWRLVVERAATNGNDTLAGDVGFLGLKIWRAG